MPHSVTPRYRDSAGVLHHVWLERSPSGRWRVLDVGARGAELVEELTDRDDRRPQAEALARDYATQAQIAARGTTDGDHGLVAAA